MASSQGQVIGMAGMRSLAPDVAEIVVWGTAYRCCGSGIGTATLQQVAMCLFCQRPESYWPVCSRIVRPSAKSSVSPLRR